MILHLTNAEEFAKVIKENKNVLIDFNATWCGPCRMMGRTIEAVDPDYSDVTFLKVDTDEFGAIAQQFGVISIPCMVAYKDGARVHVNINGSKEEALVGALPEDSFRAVLDATFRV